MKDAWRAVICGAGLLRKEQHNDEKGEGKTAFVTGASQGIGRSISLVVAEQGADIVLADIAPEGAHSAARDGERVGRKALVVQADVTRRDSVDAAV